MEAAKSQGKGYGQSQGYSVREIVSLAKVYSIADGQPASHRSSLPRLVWLALLSGMVTTAWDLAMDPALSGVGLWIWEEGGPYFGVPIQNFVGWMVTTFAIYLLTDCGSDEWGCCLLSL